MAHGQPAVNIPFYKKDILFCSHTNPGTCSHPRHLHPNTKSLQKPSIQGPHGKDGCRVVRGQPPPDVC